MNGVAAVQHGMISHINADVRRAGGVVRFLKEDQIAGFRICRGNVGANLPDALSTESAEAPAYAAVVVDVADETGAIERGLGLDDYGCIRRRFDYALYGRHSRYVRTGSRLDAIINMYVVYRTYINKNTIR